MVSIDASGTAVQDSHISLSAASDVNITARGTLAVYHAVASAYPVLLVDNSGTKLRDSVIDMRAEAGITVMGGGVGTRFLDDVNITGQLAVVAASGSVSLQSVNSTIDVATSLRIKHLGVDVLAFDPAGLAIRDSAIAVTGTDSLTITAGNKFSVVQSLGGAEVLRIDGSGTRLTDSVISLVGSNGIDIEGGGSGTLFKDLVTMNQGLNITSGAVTAVSNSVISLDAASSMTLTADTAVHIQHANTDVVKIDANGFSVSDSAMALRGVASVGVIAGGSFSLTHGIGAFASVVMTVNKSGTRLTDSVISLVGSDGIDIEGGGSGTLFKDLVTMNQGLNITSGAVTAVSNSVISLDAASSMTLTADTAVHIQHANTDVVKIDANGFSVSDNSIALSGTDVSVTAQGTFGMYHQSGNGVASLKVDSNGLFLSDSAIQLNGTQGIDFVGVSKFHHLVQMESGLSIKSGAVTINSNDIVDVDAVGNVTVSDLPL